MGNHVTRIRQSTTGKLHLSDGIHQAKCTRNRHMAFVGYVAAKNSLVFPVSNFCIKCFGSDHRAVIKQLLKDKKIK